MLSMKKLKSKKEFIEFTEKDGKLNAELDPTLLDAEIALASQAVLDKQNEINSMELVKLELAAKRDQLLAIKNSLPK